MKPRKKTLLTALLVLCALSVSEYCLARAGGGGGQGGGGALGVIIGIIIAPFVIIYQAIVNFNLKKKNKAVQSLIAEISQKDSMWNYRALNARVEEVFFKVQKAWTDRNQDYARDCMSDRIYIKHKLQTDEMMNKGTINVLERINLIETSIFSVSDYKNDDMDTFSARIKASMVDYHINEQTQAVISGDSNKSTVFMEIWTFVRSGNKWLLDEIDQKVNMSDIKEGQSFSEG